MKTQENPAKKQDDRPLRKRKSSSLKWPLTMLGASFVMSVGLSYLSSEALAGVSYIPAFLILLAFVALGVVSDIVGVAATSAVETPFHSMAARKVRGSTQAVWILRNAEKVSNVCNDVVGDICGIISGTTSAVIVLSFAADYELNAIVMQLVITGCIAGLTIGGKAFGKSIALKRSNDIIFSVGRVMSVFSRRKNGKN